MSLQRRSIILVVAVVAAGVISLPVKAPALAPSKMTPVAATGGGVDNHPLAHVALANLAQQPTQQVTSPELGITTHETASGPLLQAPLLASVPSVRREVFGFINAGNLGSSVVGYRTWNFSLLTTVAYFGLHVNSGDGHLVTTDTGWAIYHSSTMAAFVAYAHARGVRVIVSLNLHDFSTSPSNQVCVGLIAANAQYTINQISHEVAAAGIDGVNIDYEGTITTCSNGLTNRAHIVTFTKNLRAAMPHSYIAIDTYVGAAEDNLEFFDVPGLAPYVDSYFVMAYDMDFANYGESPLNCSSYCFNPISPLNTYRFNVTSAMAQYTSRVAASKVILGQPYYGRRGCVWNLGGPAHQQPIPG